MISKIKRLLFVRTSLYCNDLKDFGLFKETKLDNFIFKIIKDMKESKKLKFLIDERGRNYRNLVEERLKSNNFYCFCFIEESSNKIAYARWLRKGTFYHDRFKDTIELADNEAFTMDSYTPVEFRGKGLHKEMNKRMLNYCKKELKINKVYMIIFRGSEYMYLHKTVRNLGYKQINSRFYFKKEILKKIFFKKKHV